MNFIYPFFKFSIQVIMALPSQEEELITCHIKGKADVASVIFFGGKAKKDFNWLYVGIANEVHGMRRG